jgi:hypothetical protein
VVTPLGRYIRHQPKQVEQDWLDEQRSRLLPTHWLISEDANAPTDIDLDGIPDIGWLRADIVAWLDKTGISIRAGLTKKQLLKKVEEHLAPEEEEVSTEENKSEDALAKDTQE